MRIQIGLLALGSLFSLPASVAPLVAKDILDPPPESISCNTVVLDTIKVLDAGGKEFLLTYPDPKVDRVCGAGALKHLIDEYKPKASP
jgi:hypothetical protein